MTKKLFLFLLTTILMSGCVSLSHISAYEQLMGLDLRPYAEQDFLITPYPYSGKYTSVGVIDYKVMPQAQLVATSTSTNPQSASAKKWITDTVQTAVVLDKIYHMSVEMGANALVDFKVLEASDNYTGIANPVVITGVRITGLAIRRDDLIEK